MRNKIIQLAKELVGVDHRETRTVYEKVLVPLLGERTALAKRNLASGIHYTPPSLRTTHCDTNVRSIEFNHLYASAACEVYGDVELMDGYTVGQFIRDLQDLRREYKKKFALSMIDDGCTPCELNDNRNIQFALKVILNSFMFHGIPSYDYGMSYNKIVGHACMMMRSTIRDIIRSGGTFIVADVDKIVYAGDYVDVPNYTVHHDTHSCVVVDNADMGYILIDGRFKSRYGKNLKRMDRLVRGARSETIEHFNLWDREVDTVHLKK